MNGVVEISVRFGKTSYEFSLKRNITIIDDYSATGKSTLIRALSTKRNKKGVNSVTINSSGYKVAVFTEDTWDAAQHVPELYKNTIIFIDELQDFVDTPKFAKFVKETGTYFVLITRAEVGNLPYSAKEIYTVKTSGKKHTLEPKYTFSDNFLGKNSLNTKPNIILVEDKKSGYSFFEDIAENNSIICKTSDGKSNIAIALNNEKFKKIIAGKILMIVCDSAAIGCDIKDITTSMTNNCVLYGPESFEYMILNSDIFDSFNKDILLNTYNYIDPIEHVSWERFYTHKLREESKDTEYVYNKNILNPNYLVPETKNKILKANNLGFLVTEEVKKKVIEPINRMNLLDD